MKKYELRLQDSALREIYSRNMNVSFKNSYWVKEKKRFCLKELLGFCLTFCNKKQAKNLF